MTSTKVGSKSHNSENRLQTCSAIKKSHYPDTKRIYEKLDKLEERFRLLEEEIDDLTDKALEIKWEIESGLCPLIPGYDVKNKEQWENFIFRIKNNLYMRKQIAYNPEFREFKKQLAETAIIEAKKESKSAYASTIFIFSVSSRDKERKVKNEFKYLKDSIIDLEYRMRMFHKKLENIVEQCQYIYSDNYDYNTDTSDSNCSDILPNVVSVKKIHESKDLGSIHSKPKKKRNKNKVLSLTHKNHIFPCAVSDIIPIRVGVIFERYVNSFPEKVASDINIPELDPCSLCNQELFLFEIKNPITILVCGHIYHRDCIENSIKKRSICPKPDCKKEVKSTIDSMPGSQNINDLMDISPTLFKDTKIHESTSQKRTNDYILFPDKPFNKKAKKQVKKEDSPILKKLINELTTSASEDASCYYSFGDALSKCLYYYKSLKHGELASQALVNEEVREQIGEKISNDTFRKRTEKARKIYALFNSIFNDKGKKMIKQVKTFSASSISKLSWEDIEYVITKIIRFNQ
ncbi:hypothetical protein Glove_123g69 [Diversispora epigaea]|uniref:RING-type domain-containing protein n=1 Tax=Diversispora epigaea TaxID=1348612 RepID=A0A397J396_9GLOM|nr:hypothetical protein Glove_123g69 [Diversispora epigaea]